MFKILAVTDLIGRMWELHAGLFGVEVYVFPPSQF